uniref:Glutaredoxin domain-containing protein n=1 Tax=Grammatophora oceanica TaxID=210454 RepID=A0A7S1Y6M0_9STRA
MLCSPLFVILVVATASAASAFSVGVAQRSRAFTPRQKQPNTALCMVPPDDETLNKAIEMMTGGGSDAFETPDMTQARIGELVEEHSVLLFMKGAKDFPQCGFSDTATKILETFKVDYHTVDVLADQAIREGVKIFSQWPTIPQLYVGGEFIGGSDIMMEMYESGELKGLVEKATS